RRLARTGRVCRRSTTPTTCCNGLSKASRWMLKRMADPRSSLVKHQAAVVGAVNIGTSIEFRFISTSCRTSICPRLSVRVVEKLWAKTPCTYLHRSSTSSAGKYPDEPVPVLMHARITVAQIPDGLGSVHYRRMISPAESFADF